MNWKDASENLNPPCLTVLSGNLQSLASQENCWNLVGNRNALDEWQVVERWVVRVKFGRFVYSKRWRRIWSDNEVIAKFSFSHSRGEVVAVVNVTLDVTLNFHSSQFSVFLDANMFEMRQLCHMCELSWPFKIDGGCQVKISQGCKDSFSLPFARLRWRREFVPTNHDD